jgi:hypothetical protein
LRAKEIRGFLLQYLIYGLEQKSLTLLYLTSSPNPFEQYFARFWMAVLRLILNALYFVLGYQHAAFYQMIDFSSYCRTFGVKRRELVPARYLYLNMPNIYPEDFKKFIHSGTWKLQVPSIYAFELSKVSIMGRSDLLFSANQCFHHGLYQFDRDFLYEEMHEMVDISYKKNILIRLKGRKTRSIESGISLVGSVTANYIHWLTEMLPKLALIDSVDAYKDIPFIIDAELHQNIMESFHLLNLRGRSIIKVSRDELIAIDRLIMVSPVAYVPFDFKPKLIPDKININPGSLFFSPDGLRVMREVLVARLRGAVGGKKKQRFFLRRSGKSRPINNSIEVEAMVLEHGFEVIEPETLSFADQVRLFSSAELIVSQGGAALGNIIFAPAGCHVIVLTTWSPYIIHYYFSNLASVMMQRCTLVMCDSVQSEPGQHRAHMGLNVSIPNLIKAIQQ